VTRLSGPHAPRSDGFPFPRDKPRGLRCAVLRRHPNAPCRSAFFKSKRDLERCVGMSNVHLGGATPRVARSAG
jgi:hypothetical protein